METGLLLLIVAVLWMLTAIFISGHATENDKTGWWGLAVFFTGIFGLLGYAISLASD